MWSHVKCVIIDLVSKSSAVPARETTYTLHFTDQNKLQYVHCRKDLSKHEMIEHVLLTLIIWSHIK